MSRLDATAKKYGQIHGGGRTVAIDYDHSAKLLAAADAADAAAKIHRISLDEESLRRTAERSWDSISKRDQGRTWAKVGERSQALWMENVRNVLEAAALERCECSLVGCPHQPALTEAARQRLLEEKLAQGTSVSGVLR